MRRRLLIHESSVRELVWDAPVVTLSYSPDIAPSSGGSMLPTVSWYQIAYYSDDSSKTEVNRVTGTSATGYTSSGSFSINSTSGVVTVSSTTVETQLTLGTVTAYVTSNGVTGYSDPYTIMQAAYQSTSELSMDVLLWNKNTRDRYFVSKNDWSIANYPASTYEPLGIVVIPRTHSRYGNSNTIGVMALRNATADASEVKVGTYTDNDTLAYGDYSEGSENNYSDIRVRTQASIPYNVSGTTINSSYLGTVTDYSQLVYFPSDDYADNNSKLANTLDSDTYYAVSTMLYGAPSPYNNGNASSLYGTSNNDTYCFGRFDGDNLSHDYMFRLHNTEDFNSWLNDEEVPQGSADTSSSDWEKVLPAMEACWRYSPVGSCEGTWHLPSAGEFGYIMSRKKAINNTIKALDDAYYPNDTQHYALVSDGYITATEFVGSERDRTIIYNETAVTTAKNWAAGLVKPFKEISGVSGYGNLGCESMLKLYGNLSASDENFNCPDARWCLYREYSAQRSYESSYPSGKIASGDVYGILVAGQDDLTILKTGVKLFSISDVDVDAYEDEIETCKNYGYYNLDIEPGWYVIEHIECTDSNGDSYTIDNIKSSSRTVGNKLTDSNWNGFVSICYKYPYMRGISKDDYSDAPYNTNLFAFRVNYWSYNTAIFLHGAEHDASYDLIIPREFKYTNPENFSIHDLEYSSSSIWNSTDEVNIVKGMISGRRQVSAGQSVGISVSNLSDLTFVTLTKGSSKYNSDEYARVATKLLIQLSKNETDAPYKTVLLLDTNDATIGDGITGSSASWTYEEYFARGGDGTVKTTIEEDCYANIVLLITEVNLGAGAKVEIHGNEVGFIIR